MSKPKSNIINKLESFFSKYVAAPAEYHFVAALWAAMTYIYRDMDTVPYLCITSMTKRSGKTLFGIDLLRHVCSQPLNATAMTGAVLYRKLHQNNGGVLFADEAETLASESAGKLRSVLNIGYKRGQTVPVTVGGEVVDMPVFGPKCFVLIGDVNDTLRDRSIVFYMRRATPEAEMKLSRYNSTNVETEAQTLTVEVADTMASLAGEISKVYRNHEGLNWLPARDAEIWLSLFAICQVIAPERLTELMRVATDLATDKTADNMKYNAESARDAEKKAERAEYCVRMIRDISTVCGSRKYVLSEEIVGALKELPMAPWRRYKGRGVTEQDIGYLLPPRLRAKNIKVSSKPVVVRRGFAKKDLDSALADLGELVKELNASE